MHLECDSYTGETSPEWLQGTLGEDGAALLDVSASFRDGWVTLCVVNVDEERAFETEVMGVKGEVDIFKVTGANVKCVNVEGNEEVSLKESKWDGKGKYTFEKHSLTMLRWKV